MKKAALYAYTLLVFGWIVCLQYDDTLGLNVLTPYWSAFRAEKPATTKKDIHLVRVAAGGVIKIFCSNEERKAGYTAMINYDKLPGNAVIVYSYSNYINNSMFCFNKY